MEHLTVNPNILHGFFVWLAQLWVTKRCLALSVITTVVFSIIRLPVNGKREKCTSGGLVSILRHGTGCVVLVTSFCQLGLVFLLLGISMLGYSRNP
jgi:hypothetical protein